MNNADAVGLRDWLKREGWDDVFLDVDPDRGIAAGQRWERALNEAAHRCEAVLFVVVARVAGLGLVCQRVQPGAPSKQTACSAFSLKTSPLPICPSISPALGDSCGFAPAATMSCCASQCRLPARKLTSPSRRKASCSSRPDYSAPASIPGSSLGRRKRPEPAALSWSKTAGSRGRRHFLRARCADRRGARSVARVAMPPAPPARHFGRVGCRQILVLCARESCRGSNETMQIFWCSQWCGRSGRQ